MARDGRLADPLPRSHDGDRRELERRTLRRIEAEVRAHVGQAGREHAAREGEPLDGPENRLVREVDDDLGRVRLDRGLDVQRQRHSVLLAAAQLLLSAHEHGGDELVGELLERVAHDGGVVLAVDYGERLHVRVVTSSSIAPVNFAYSSVSSENETSRTWPWNGWRRQISTRFSSISITL